MRLHFWSRRARWRARLTGKFTLHLALVAAAVIIAVKTGQLNVILVVVAAAAIAVIFTVGSFTAAWRNAGVTVSRQYRRLARRGGRR